MHNYLYNYSTSLTHSLTLSPSLFLQLTIASILAERFSAIVSISESEKGEEVDGKNKSKSVEEIPENNNTTTNPDRG